VKGYTAKVQFPEWDGMVSGWLPVAQLATLGAKVWIMPRVGAQVGVLIDEHGEDGIILGGIYSGADPAPECAALAFHIELEDGTALTLEAGKATIVTPGDLVATAGGSATVTAGGTATVKATKVILDAPLVQATQVLQVDGLLCANGGISTTSGASVPGDLRVAGTIHSDTKLTGPDATLGGIDFLEHAHQAQGSNSVTSAPL
jgi:phage baseplate assembly protein V